MLKGEEGEMRLRVGDYRVRYTEEDEDAIRVHSVKDFSASGDCFKVS